MAKTAEQVTKKPFKAIVLREFESFSREDLIFHILELRAYSQELEKKINNFDQVQSKIDRKDVLTEKHYKQEWSLATKIVFLVKLKQKLMTSEDVHLHLMKIDKHYRDQNDPRAHLGTNLHRLSKSKRLLKFKFPGIKFMYFALPDWVGTNGKVKDEFSKFLRDVV